MDKVISLPSMLMQLVKTSSIHQALLIQLWLVTDTQTDTRRQLILR